MRRIAFALLAPLALAACEREEFIHVTKSWVRLPAAPGAPAAAYFTINGGPSDDRLIRVSTPIAIKTELHDTVREGGVVRMTALQGVDVPAKRKIEFTPGGKHVMLFNMRAVRPGGTVRLDFTFASGYQIYVDAPAQAAGTADPHADH